MRQKKSGKKGVRVKGKRGRKVEYARREKEWE